MTLRQRKHDQYLTFYSMLNKPKKRVTLSANLSRVIRQTVALLNKQNKQK